MQEAAVPSRGPTRLKILRHLPVVLGSGAVLVVLVVAAVFSPTTQTWAVRRVLKQHPEWHATVGEVAAGLSQVEITNFRAESAGSSLVMPSVRLELPVWKSWRERRLSFRRVVAKDWVLRVDQARGATGATGEMDAGGAKPKPAAKTKTAKTGTAKTAAMEAGKDSWRGFRFPWDVSFDGVEIEGDVTAKNAGDGTTIHVVLDGGGLSVGQTGRFKFATTVFDTRLPAGAIAARGEIAAEMKDARTLGRATARGVVVESGPAAAKAAEKELGFELSADLSEAETVYRLALARSGRGLGNFQAKWPAADETIAGSWELNAKAGDLVVFGGKLASLPAIAGGGRFVAKTAGGAWHAGGEVHAAAGEWPWLERWGAIGMDAKFEIAREGPIVRVEKLELAAAAGRPLVELRALQPFDFDLKRHTVTVRESGSDWLAVNVRGWPVRWLASGFAGLEVSDDVVTGEIAIAGTGGAFTARTKAPLAAKGLSVVRGGRVMAQALDFSADGSARLEAATGAWQVELAPVMVTGGGKSLARCEARFSRAAGREQPVDVAATWSADLEAVAASGTISNTAWLTARAASGEISGTIAGYADLLGKVAVVGHDPAHTVNASVRADLYPDGTVAIGAPMTFAWGKNVSDVRLDWEWRGDAPAMGVDVKLAGKSVALEQLELLAGPLAAFGHAATTARSGGPGEVEPFWGDWRGRARIDLERLRLTDRELIDVGGYLKFEHGRLELIGGHGGPAEHSLAQIDATLTFDATRERPYELTATAASYPVDAEGIFGAAKDGKEPVFMGRFTVERSLGAKGATLAELVAGREETFKLTSKNGIVRMLKCGVAQALPSAAGGSKVVDALGDVGTAFGRLLGSKAKSMTSGQVKVSATTDAVLEFDREMAEIGYDQLAITAIRGGDGAMRFPTIELTAAEVHLAGAGEMSAGKDNATLPMRAVSAKLQLGVRGRMAELLTQAGLLSAEKDAKDYRTAVGGPIEFGGTLNKLTQDAWRARLVEAATRKPEAGKK